MTSHVRPFPCRGLLPFLAIAIASMAGVSPAQQVNLNQPFQANGGSNFEQSGVHGGLRGNGFFFNLFGGPAVAPFGNPDPQAGVQGGLGVAGGGLNGGFGFGLSQGGNFSSVSQTGNLTVRNGYPGWMSDLSLSPFVTGIIPTVGDRQLPWKQQWDGAVPMQLRSATTNTTSRGSGAGAAAAPDELQSVAEIRRRNDAEEATRLSEVRQQLARASDAEANGKPQVALAYLRAALRNSPESLRETVQSRIERLSKR